MKMRMRMRMNMRMGIRMRMVMTTMIRIVMLLILLRRAFYDRGSHHNIRPRLTDATFAIIPALSAIAALQGLCG